MMRTSQMQHSKAKASMWTKNNHAVFELKHKVLAALNKLADRDTYQLGVEELDKIVEALSPEGVAPFLSCILDTDAEQKNTVRKECVRLMGHLANFHEDRIGQHLGKMVASIVKRLKDPDTIVKDACVQTVAILASKLGSHDDVADDATFAVLVKPLFESLGEQNKQLQSGSALCLARVIDHTRHPPIAILERMLNRTIKFLKNPHFLAKPAVIKLNKSIIEAGGALSQSLLSAAMNSIQEALKSTDWNTRSAASVALGDIASSGDPILGSFRASCIHSLEQCRFDKVKPVREKVLHALKLWRSVPGCNTSEMSQTGSSIRENSFGDYADVSSVSDSGRNDLSIKKPGGNASKLNVLLSDRVSSKTYGDHSEQFKENNWHVEISAPKTHYPPSADSQIEESVISSAAKTFDRMKTKSLDGVPAGDMSSPYSIYGYAPGDEKQESASSSNLVNDFCKSRFAQEFDGMRMRNVSENSAESSPQSEIQQITTDKQRVLTKVQDRRSFDSTLTNSSSQLSRACCMQTASEIVSLKKQLSEIQNKQSSVVDMLQMFTTRTMDSLNKIQSKVFALENAVNQIAHSVLPGVRYPNAKIPRSPLVSSETSVCTPRPSVGMNTGLPPSSTENISKLWEEKDHSVLSKQETRKSDASSGSISKYPNAKISKKNFLQQRVSMESMQRSTVDGFSTQVPRGQMRESGLQSKDSSWECVKGFLSEGDLDSAYAEALCSEDEFLLVELLGQISPSLDRITRNTSYNLLSVLASFLYEKKYIKAVLPWIQQIVELNSTHGSNYLCLSSKLKEELLMGIQEAASSTYSSPLEKRSMTQLGTKLCFMWGLHF